MESLKVAEISIWASKQIAQSGEVSNTLRLTDNLSVGLRFNDEKAWTEWALARMVPTAATLKETAIRGIISGIHSDWVYGNLEAVVDGIIDFKLEEVNGEMRNLMRIRSLKNVGFDSRWHLLNIGENFEVTLEK